MLSKPLPQNPTELLRWSWDDFAPLYQELNDRRVTFENIDIWMTDWSHLDECVEEQMNRLYYHISANTADKEAQKRYEDFMNNFLPKFLEANNRLQKQLLASGVEVPGFEVQLAQMRETVALFREENLPLISEVQNLSAEYDRIIGAQTVIWNGQEETLTQLRLLMEDDNRDLREKAWRAVAERQLADQQAINQLWTKLYNLRQKIAANAGKPDYRAYRWQELLRLDYTPADNEQFLRSIEEVVVPAAERIYERRRAQMGIDSLRPWDLEVDPLGRPALDPYEDVNDLIAKISVVFHHVHPDLGEYFDTMVNEKLLDLENRKNKAPGASCTDFSMIHRPFIFANSVGLHDDVQTLLHEAGHAFHAFESSALPYNQQRHAGSEFAEVASMGMELLAGRYLDAQPGGFYNEADANRARARHLESAILFWPYMAVVDAFQHWAYTNPQLGSDPAACNAKWAELWKRFMRGLDWSSLDEIMMTGWQRKLHITTLPFYYVEYGLAQLGAVQVWNRSLKDSAGAVQAYRRALALGATASLPQLFDTAGAKFAFDAETLGQAVSAMETMILALEQTQH